MMFGKLSVALLLTTSPALAQDVPESANGAVAEAEAPVAFKTKRVCRSIEVVGSSIPRTTCTTKKVPIKPVIKPQPVSEAGESIEAKAPEGE